MRNWTYFLLMGILFFMYSCETKVDLIAEGEESPITYGFIDPSVDTQFVKITKSFITDGNAFEGAQDASLSEYVNLEAWIVEWDDEDSIGSYLLKEKTITDKDSGVFYYPVQLVYYTDEIIFEDDDDPKYDNDFEIRYYGSGRNVSSKTAVVGAFEEHLTQAIDVVSFVTNFNLEGSTYQNKAMKVQQAKNVKRYEFTLRYHYIEVYNDGSQQVKFMDFKFPVWVTDGLSGSESKTWTIKGENFYQSVESKLIAQDNEANVARRIIGELEYIFDYAGRDLNTYIELNKPATSFNSEQNPYSNLTNSVGVWSSRGQSLFTGKTLQVRSIQEMAEGQYTGAYKFCSDDPGHNGLSFGCN